MPTTRKHKRSGTHFDWHPTSFEGAQEMVNLARGEHSPLGLGLAQAMRQVIHHLGGLECPAPSSDPHGVYRVGLDPQGRPTIQRQGEDGAWQAVS